MRVRWRLRIGASVVATERRRLVRAPARPANADPRGADRHRGCWTPWQVEASGRHRVLAAAGSRNSARRPEPRVLDEPSIRWRLRQDLPPASGDFGARTAGAD